MQKVIVLNPLGLTRSKQIILDSIRSEALSMLYKHILPILDEVEDKGELQKRVYHNIRGVSTLHSQVVLNLIRNSISLKEKPVGCRDVKRITLDCNIPRAGKVFTLDTGTYCVKLNLAKRKSVVIPISENRMLQRLENHIANGWMLKQMSITMDNRILAVIEKRKTYLKVKNIMGIDINANNLTATIITPKCKIVKQLYLGYGIWKHKAKILHHRSKLQSIADKGSCRARGKLKLLRRRLRNFTRNNTGELSKQIHELALKYDAKIVMERLTKFTADKTKKANRKISLIPFRLIQERIATRSVDTGIPLRYVDPYHTSKWCPRCGSVNPSHSKPYAIYRCSSCGLIMNSDRKASLAIAVKKLAERKHITHQVSAIQISAREVPVNALFRRNEEVIPIDSVSHGLSLTKAPCESMG